MHLKLTTYLSILFLFFINIKLVSQNTIKLNIKNSGNNKVMIAYHFGEKQYLLTNEITGNNDILLDKNGFGTFTSNDLKRGLLMLVFPPKNETIEFFYDGNDLDISLDRNQIQESIAFKNSETNTIFYEYTAFILKLNNEKNKITELHKEHKNDELLNKEIANIQLKYENYYAQLLKNHTNNLAVKFLKASKNIEIPNSLSDDERFYYFKKNYFNNLNFDDDWLIRTPFFIDKILYYVEKLCAQNEKEITESIDYIIGLSKDNPEMYQYLVSTFLNTFAKSELMIGGNVYAHIVENYYASGKANWISSDQLNKILVSYTKMKNSVIGKEVADFYMINPKNNSFNLYSLKSDYKVLFFWTPPFYKSELTNLKNEIPKNTILLSIAKSFNTKERQDWLLKYPQKLSMNIIKSEEKDNVLQTLNINNLGTTRSVFVLDKNNKILAKSITLDQALEFINNLNTTK